GAQCCAGCPGRAVAACAFAGLSEDEYGHGGHLPCHSGCPGDFVTVVAGHAPVPRRESYGPLRHRGVEQRLQLAGEGQQVGAGTEPRSRLGRPRCHQLHGAAGSVWQSNALATGAGIPRGNWTAWSRPPVSGCTGGRRASTHLHGTEHPSDARCCGRPYPPAKPGGGGFACRCGGAGGPKISCKLQAAVLGGPAPGSCRRVGTDGKDSFFGFTGQFRV
ncbi:unnamed protein product, partial [Symbiodinium microadriaticum]